MWSNCMELIPSQTCTLTHRRTSEAEEISIRTEDYTYINTLVVILHYGFAICCPWGNWVKSTWDLPIVFLITSHEHTWAQTKKFSWKGIREVPKEMNFYVQWQGGMVMWVAQHTMMEGPSVRDELTGQFYVMENAFFSTIKPFHFNSSLKSCVFAVLCSKVEIYHSRTDIKLEN